MSRPSVSRPMPTVNTGICARAQSEQRFLDRRFLGVGSVGHHHETSQRQARKFVLCALQRFAQLRLRAVERQLAGGADAVGVRRESEDADGVAARQRLHHRAVGRERRVDELAARLTVVIGDAHAARVVQQDAEKVLLRHGRAKNQNRPEETEENQADKAEAQRDEHHPVEPAGVARSASIREHGRERRRRRQSRRDVDRRRQREAQLALLKHVRRILEEKCKQRVEHGTLS